MSSTIHNMVIVPQTSLHRFAVRSFRYPMFDILDYAMRYHNDGLVSDDPTIGACWDADRLDLPRVGIEPNARLMSTECGRLPSTLEWVRNIQVADGVIAGG